MYSRSIHSSSSKRSANLFLPTPWHASNATNEQGDETTLGKGYLVPNKQEVALADREIFQHVCQDIDVIGNVHKVNVRNQLGAEQQQQQQTRE